MCMAVLLAAAMVTLESDRTAARLTSDLNLDPIRDPGRDLSRVTIELE